MFENIETELMNFIESLEEKCIELIYNSSSTWFEDPIEKVDIDNAFIPTLKLYKSGKFFLIHVFIKPTIKFFNEEEMIIPLEEIKDESMLTIIEIKGIKFNNKSFQIEIELKQSMIIKADPFSEKCFFQKPNYSDSLEQKNSKIEINDVIEEVKEIIEEPEPEKEEIMEIMEINIEDLLNKDTEENIHLKNHEEVYLEMYKKCLEKAKSLKKQAIESFLEAQNIQKTYMLKDLENDEEDFYSFN
jgi:hypothetical protein